MISFIDNRLARLRQAFDQTGIDALMVLVGENRRYLSGFTGEDAQFDESAGALFITADRLLLATDSRYTLQARREAPLYTVYCCTEGLVKALPDILDSLKARRLGFEKIRMSFGQYEKMTDMLNSKGVNVSLVATENLVENLRLIKEEAEIDAIRRSLSIAETVFSNLFSALAPGMTEKEAAWLMEKGMRESGAETTAFPTIVASGPNSALPHAIPGDRTFGKGEPILFDWGAKRNGYASDISRTFAMGRPDDMFQRVYDAVFDAQQKAVAAMAPGRSSKDVDAAARNRIEAAGFKDNFSHGLGHGVGLAVHENPRLSPSGDDLLQPGMVFTVEPGIYIANWGGVRLENMAVLRENGAEILNRLDPRDHMRIP